MLAMTAGSTPGVIQPPGPWYPVTYDGDAHLLCCAATGMGKGRSVLNPILLTCPNPLLVIDIKGESYQVTARCRREMGHQVVAVDPFHLVTDRSDGLNPLDLLLLPRADADSDSEMLASLLAVGHESADDPFWHTSAKGLIAGLIAHIASYPPGQRHLGHLREWIYSREMDPAIATLLNNNMVKSRLARELLSAYMAAPEERTRPCIRATAATYLDALGSQQVVDTLRTPSFRLQDVHDGKPLSIYIIIPPDKLESHKSLLRLWVGTLLTAVMRRAVMPRQRTLFLIDEAAQLGPLPQLRQAITLLRGSGLQTFTFWQDLSQLRNCYPNDWQTIINNSGILEVFGITNHKMAKEWSEFVGMPPEQLAQLPREDAVVYRQGQGSLVCRRPDYLTDPEFAGLFDPNPRFALQERLPLAHR
jgi:type IV secretion system protein VirD4